MRGCGLLVMGAILHQSRRYDLVEGGGDLESHQSRRHGEVAGGGDLESLGVAVDDKHMPPDPLNEPGVVGGVAPVRMGVLKHLAQETLRSLYGTQRLAIGGRQNATLIVDHLDGIGYCKARHDGGVARAYRVDHPGEQIRGCETTGRVMNQDDAVVRMQRGEPSSYRGSPISTPGDDLDTSVTTGKFAGRSKVGGGGDDDDMSDLSTTQDAPQRVSQQRLTTQRGECLGRPGTKPNTTAGGDENDDDLHDAMTRTTSRWRKVR